MKTDLEEKKIIAEHNFDECREKSLAVCDLLAQGTSLKSALALQRIEAADFYRTKLNTPEVQKAYTQAQQMLAEIKLSDISEMGKQLIDEEGLTTNTFNAVTKNERWVIEKLSPERFGTRPNAAPTSMVQNNVQILQGMTDEQIIALANGSLQALNAPEDKKVLDNTIEAQYSENIGSEEDPISPFTTTNESTINDVATDLTFNNSASTSAGPYDGGNPTMSKYDISAFGDLK